MVRTAASRVAGALLLLYGLAAVAMGWWAYSVTREAYASIRSFSAVFDRERGRAVEASRGLSDLTRSRDPVAGPQPPGAAPTPSAGPALAREVQRIEDRLGGILGGARPGEPARPGFGSASAPAAQPSEARGPLDELEGRLVQLVEGWSALGDGPVRSDLLGRMELVTNVVLLWMAAHGAASVLGGFLLIRRRPAPARPRAGARPAEHPTPTAGPAPDSTIPHAPPQAWARPPRPGDREPPATRPR